MQRIQRIAARGDEVAGDDGEVRTSLERRVDDAAEIAIAEKSASMDVAQLQDPQAFQIGRQLRNGDIDLAHLKVEALHESAVPEHRDRRGHNRISGGREDAPPACIGLCPASSRAPLRTTARTTSQVVATSR